MRHGYIRTAAGGGPGLQHQQEHLAQAGVDRVWQEQPGARGRPVYNQMLDQLRAGDAIVVISLDRITRHTYRLVSLTDRGIAVIGTDDGTDTTAPAGRTAALILAHPNCG
jgi:DNA invertase Pin-like site-specific DNA recombinase